MRRLYMYTAIAVSAIIIIFTILFVTLRILFPPEALRKIVSDELNGRLGRPVTFGAVGFSILRGFALDVEDFRIEETEGFPNEYLVSMEHFILKVRIRPLFQRRIEIAELAFIKPEMINNTPTRTLDKFAINFI